ncbi:MAG: DUF1993 domain-containing protein [Leptospira sp.]|nr:DUF1993 domain-containing protein [Leptospira sp.]
MLYQITIEQFSKGLSNLIKFLEKTSTQAEAKKIDFNVLLNSRLIADQFALIKQIQIACDTAKFAASRITGKDAPSFDDSEKTLSDLKTRIEATINYLKTFKETDFNGAKDIKVSQPRWEGKYMNGEEYLLHHALPNFYFHITTAYAILRSNGLDIGKKDYLGEMPFKS